MPANKELSGEQPRRKDLHSTHKLHAGLRVRFSDGLAGQCALQLVCTDRTDPPPLMSQVYSDQGCLSGVLGRACAADHFIALGAATSKASWRISSKPSAPARPRTTPSVRCS